MASTLEKIQHLGYLLRNGHHGEASALIGNRLRQWARKPFRAEKERGSPLLHHKLTAIHSLLDFYEGGPQPEWPLELFIEVSNVCDLQCAMCPTFSALSSQRFTSISKRHRGFFDIDLLDGKLKEVLEHVLVVHAFGYGEPTLHPQFTTLLRKLGSYGVMVDFFTHGMHLDDSLCAEMVKQRVSKITVSFSGSTRNDYENVYLGGDFDRVLGNLKRLSQHKEAAGTEFPLIVVNSLAFQHHVEQLPEFVRIMGDAGANVIHLKPLQIVKKIEELHGHASRYDPDKQRKMLEEAQQIAKQYGITLGTTEYEGTAQRQKPNGSGQQPAIPISDLGRIAKEKRRKKGELGKRSDEKIKIKIPPTSEVAYRHDSSMHCTEPFKTLYLSYEGAAYPCCFKELKSMWGDLNNSNATEIWQSKLMESLRHHVARQDYPELLCSNCMKTRAYPKRNPARMHILHYSKWHEDRFGIPLNDQLIQRVRDMPEWNEPLFRHMRDKQVLGQP